MSYCNLDDLRIRYTPNRVNNLIDRNNDGSVDPGVVDARAQDAVGTIHSYLSGRYALPFPVTPPAIKPICCAIVWYLLHMGNAPEGVEKSYEAAIKELKRYRDEGGIIDINGNPLPAPNIKTSFGAEFYAPERVFSNEKLSGY